MAKNHEVRRKNNYYILLLVLELICLPLVCWSAPNNELSSSVIITQQNEIIKGRVVDSKTGEPIIGASVKVRGTTIGTITNTSGEFSLNIPHGANLDISYLGYKKEAVSAVNGQTVSLKEDNASLDEVVITGYSQQRKESLTGAMQSIKGDNLKDVTSTSIENMLNSKIVGVYVTPGSGQPGASGNVVIRGQASLSGDTSPLWVVDGVIVGNSPGSISVNDIASMTVLKDAASTAIYGSEGANGVIVVTTKQPKQENLKIDASVKFGTTNLNRGKLRMMTGSELYDYYKSFENVDEVSFPRWNMDLRNSNFDWYKLATQTGSVQDYSIDVSGGSKNINNYLSTDYYDEKGAVKGYSLGRYSFRYNGQITPKKWITIKPQFSGSYTDTHDQQYSVSAMYSMLPWDSPYDKDGNIVPNYYSGWVNSTATNYLFDLQYNHSEYKYYDFSGGVNVDIKIIPCLTFSSVNNYRIAFNKYHYYEDPRSSSGEGVNGRIEENREDITRRYTNQLLRFNKTWGLHNVSALLAFEYKDYKYTYEDAKATGFVQSFDELSVASIPEAISGYKTEWAVNSYFFKGNYIYNNCYMAELSLRRDGASNFGEDHKYGNFFSISGGWNINNEPWFHAPWVDNLKLRAAYGSVGNRPSSLYPQYDLYSVGTSYNEEPAALISQVGNKDLTWEKTYTSGIGLDASFWNHRLYLTLDVYSKKTDNILYEVPVSGVTGVTSIWRNVGKMKNLGYEISGGGDILRNKDLIWNININIGHNKNKLIDLYKQLDDNGHYVVKPVIIGSTIAGAAQRILEVGEPIDTYYMPEWAGVNPDNGAPMWYKDDGKGNKVTTSSYSDATYYKVGHASPQLFGGFNSSLTWHNFNLEASFGYSLGGHIYSYFRQEYDSDGAYAGDRNQMELEDGWSRWEKKGDIATHPIAKYNNQDKGNLMSSRYLESNNFLKLRSLMLAYNFNLRKYGIENLKVYLSGENIFTITKYSGVDPELHSDESGTSMGMADVSIYPSTRKFVFGIDFTF